MTRTRISTVVRRRIKRRVVVLHVHEGVHVKTRVKRKLVDPRQVWQVQSMLVDSVRPLLFVKNIKRESNLNSIHSLLHLVWVKRVCIRHVYAKTTSRIVIDAFKMHVFWEIVKIYLTGCG